MFEVLLSLSKKGKEGRGDPNSYQIAFSRKNSEFWFGSNVIDTFVYPPLPLPFLVVGGREGGTVKRIFRFKLAGQSFIDLTQRKKTQKNEIKLKYLKGTSFLYTIKTCAIFFSLSETMLPGKSALLPFLLLTPSPPPPSSSSKTGRGKWSEETRRKDQRNEVGGGFSRCLAFVRVQWSVQCDTDIFSDPPWRN